jgi:hypothetical protein
MIHLSASGMNGIAAKMSFIQNLLVDPIILGHNYVVVKPYNVLIILYKTVCRPLFSHECVSYPHNFFMHQLFFAEELTQALIDSMFHVESFLGLTSLFLGIM